MLHPGAQQCHTAFSFLELQKQVFNVPPDKCMLLSLKLSPTITKPTVADSKASPETAILSADAVELMDTAYCSEMCRVATGIYEEIGEGSSLGKQDTGGAVVNGRLASLLSQTGAVADNG